MPEDDRIAQARAATAAHFKIPVEAVRRDHLRLARTAGVHDVSDRWLEGRAAGRRALRGPLNPPIKPAVPEGFAVARVTTTTGADGEVRSQAVQARPYDPEAVGEPVPEGHVEIGRSTLLGADGEPIAQWIKTATARGREAREDVLRRLVAEFAGVPRAEPRPAPEDTAADLLAVYPLGDPHIGLRGAEGSGLREGADLLLAAVTDLVQRGPRAREALVVNLGDFYHSDDPSNRTRAGGFPLDVDGEWFQILKAGRDVFLALIDRALGHHEIVNVRCMVGNHDDLSSLFLTLLVEAHYRDEPRVRLDTSGAPFQWFEWGQSLFGMTHGNTCKMNRLPGLMATKAAAAWGRTRHRHWLLGHVHHTRRVEADGVIMESFRTLAPQDAYHVARGYLSGRDLVRIVHHKEHGEVSRETVSPAMLGR